ncbi:MAG: RNA polymerase sigma factor [Limisphaerales bacterium]
MRSSDEAKAAAAGAPTLGEGFAPAAFWPKAMNTRQDVPPGEERVRDWTRAIQRGDAAAFSRFYDLYSFRIYKYLLVLAHGEEHEAQEVCQLVLIKLAKRFRMLEDEEQLWAWVRAVARNAFLDQCRARRRRDQALSIEATPLRPDTGDAAEHRLSELVRDALAGLAPEDRELLQAAYVDERPLRELADASRLTYKAIESRLGRLRQKLREKLLHLLSHEHESRS